MAVSRFGKTSIDAAHDQVERRWADALHQMFAGMPMTYAEVLDAIDGTLRTAATGAELHQRGAGLRLILKRLRIPEETRR